MFNPQFKNERKKTKGRIFFSFEDLNILVLKDCIQRKKPVEEYFNIKGMNVQKIFLQKSFFI
jgi:hypothetical protein